jgi:hypothetical protein
MRVHEDQDFGASDSSDTDDDDDDDKIGYGRPPKWTRFKPGQSGNPKGRPKARKTFGHILYAGLQRKIQVTEKGTTRKLSVYEVLAQKLLSDALRGERGSLKLLLQCLAIYIDDGEQTVGDELRAAEAANTKSSLIAKLQLMAGRIAANRTDDGAPKSQPPRSEPK